MKDRKPNRYLLLIPLFFVLLFIIFFWKELILCLKYVWAIIVLVLPFFPFYLLNADVRAFLSTQASLLWTDDVRLAWAHLSTNFLIAVITFTAMMFWMAQFVLPVRQMKERWEAVKRLFLYLRGKHGPAIFVKEGKIISDASEKKRKGPGVVLVDLKSAILLETPRAGKGIMHDPNSGEELKAAVPIVSFPSLFKRKNKAQAAAVQAYGPGLVFTQNKQKIHGAVDLRRQIRVKTSPKIDAYTRDGIKVESSVSTLFSLSEDPDTVLVTYIGNSAERNPQNCRLVLLDKSNDDSKAVVAGLFKLELEDAYEVLKGLQSTNHNSNGRNANRSGGAPTQPFPFDADRVTRAIYYLPYTAEGKTAVPWDELPSMVAIEVFRNKVAQYTFDYMHMPDDPDQFPLKRIKQEFALSIRMKGVMKYQIVFRRDGQPIEEHQDWKESDIDFREPRLFQHPDVLRDRGIKVITAGFGELVPPDDVRNELINSWRARWEKEINSTLAHRDLEAARIRNRARVKAQQDTSFVFSEIFSEDDYSEEALTVRVFQALETAATDLSEARLLPHDTINMLWSLYQWMLGDEEKPKGDTASPEENMPGGLG